MTVSTEQRPLRSGDRVRALVSDGVLVDPGLRGLVVNAVHYGYGGAFGAALREPVVTVQWENDTTSTVLERSVELLSASVLMPDPRNTVTSLSPDFGGAS